MGTEKRIEAYHEFIDLLARLHQTDPRKGHGTEALYYLEKAKSRAFLDSLEVAQVSISRGIDPRLSAEEKLLNNEITGLYKKLLTPDLTADQKNAIDEKIRKCEDDYEKLKREEIHPTSPALRRFKISGDDQPSRKSGRNCWMTGRYSYLIRSAKTLPTASPSAKRAQDFPRVPEKKSPAQGDGVPQGNFGSRKPRFSSRSGTLRRTHSAGAGQRRQASGLLPDDILYFLPFEALSADLSGKPWLVEKYSVSYAPSLSSMWEIIKRGSLSAKNPKRIFSPSPIPYTKTARGGRIPPGSSDIFQDFYSSSAFRYFRLKYSGIEAQKIAALFRPNREEILLSERASEAGIERAQS